MNIKVLVTYVTLLTKNQQKNDTRRAGKSKTTFSLDADKPTAAGNKISAAKKKGNNKKDSEEN